MTHRVLRFFAGGLLFIAGMGLSLGACSQGMVRDGHQPVAAGLAFVGWLAMFAGWAAWRSSEETVAEPQRVRLSLLFEKTALAAVLMGVWLWTLLGTFFLGALYVEDLTHFGKFMLGLLAPVIMLSVAARLTLQPAEAETPAPPWQRLSDPAKGTFVIVLLIMAGINWLPRTATFTLYGAPPINLVSRGFPQTFRQNLPNTDTGRTAREMILTLPDDISLQAGAIANSSTNVFLVTLPDHAPPQFEAVLPGSMAVHYRRGLVSVATPGVPARELDIRTGPAITPEGLLINCKTNLAASITQIGMILPSGSEREFEVRLPGPTVVYLTDNATTVTLPDGTHFEIDSATGHAVFAGIQTRRSQPAALVMNALLAILLAAYLALCHERLRRAPYP